MNAFATLLREHHLQACLIRGSLATLQVNVGDLCNQACTHCHIDASPNGKNVMSKAIVDQVLSFLSRNTIITLDITGGAPELNPHFEYVVSRARGLVDEIIVRSNLTVLFEPGKEQLPTFFKKNRIHLICSLPCYLQQNVDAQRGKGAHAKSIAALQRLNKEGFGKGDDLKLDIVYNPAGAHLPPEQSDLEKQYKERLRAYGISFDRLITITNVPIKKFKHYLESQGEYETYCALLEDNFNPEVVPSLMCKTFLSVGYDGRVYDCDFNQALALPLLDEAGRPLTIAQLDPLTLVGRQIVIDKHCLSCTAGSGSSCQGALQDKEKEMI